MRQFALKGLLSALFVLTSSFDADACPYDDPKLSWFDHFNNNKDTPRSAFIVFDNKASVPSDRPWNNACVRFTVMSQKQNPGGKLHISVWGYLNNWPSYYIMYVPVPLPSFHPISRWKVGPKSGYEIVQSVSLALPNLKKFEVAVWDDVFVYNEGGEVFHRKYGKVGRMICQPPPRDAPCMQGKQISSGRFWNDPRWY